MQIGTSPVNVFRTSGPQSSQDVATAYLALVVGIEELGEVLRTQVGLKKAPLQCHSGVSFQLQGEDSSSTMPIETDGIIELQQGRSQWRAIVEVSVGETALSCQRIKLLQELVEQEGFDALITIGNSQPTAIALHPIRLNQRPDTGAPVYHFSWESLFGEVQTLVHSTQENCEKWVLSEWLRYMDDSEGPMAFRHGLGPHWEAVEHMTREESLSSHSKEVHSVSEAWMDFLLKLSGQLSSKLGTKVQVHAPEAELADDQLQATRIAKRLANKLQLTGRLQGAGMQGSMCLGLCPATGEATFSVDLPVPPCSYQIKFLMALGDQLRNVQQRGVDSIRAYWDQKTMTTQCKISDLIKDPINLQRLDKNRKVPSHASPIRLVFERTVQLQGDGPMRSAQLLEHLASELHAFCSGAVQPMRNNCK